MNDPLLAGSQHTRVVLASGVIAIYAFLTAFELRRERRRALAAVWLNFAIPMLHSAVFLAPTGLILLMPKPAPLDDLFALFAFETMIYVVGTAFIVVVMAKDSAVQVHKTAAMTDLLTGLFNRRAFLDAADRIMAQRARKSQPVSILAFDLDRFKSINDRFGHAVGDDALKLFAQTASGNMRATDVIGRLGGEEFAAIMPCSTAEAVMVAERLRVAFEAAGVVISGHEMGATVSIGIATAPAPVSIDAILARADAALYRAKHNGRNRIEVADYERTPKPVAVAAQISAEPAVAMR
jgi:diguanylate cyclase (GGDEF)-like protein